MPTTSKYDIMEFGGGEFDGEIRDIRVWDYVVDWNEATTGQPGTGGVSSDLDDSSDSNADLPASCVASRMNTWDFVCDETVPSELAEEFGFGKAGVDPEAEQKFLLREDRGEITRCRTSTAVKSAVFHGKFGDGLTGEYFKLRQNCHPPFLFGQIPTLVKVDETINFATMNFRSAHNEYAVRWTGKILLDAGGSYSFKLTSKDGSWLAVSGRLVIDNGWCHGTQAREGTIQLAKGAHKIAVMHFNRGPRNQVSGQIILHFKGPDTAGAWIPIPQAKLGSAPMRLSKLDRHANSGESGDQNETQVKKGHFIYDEKAHIAIMPKRSCDLECRRGLRKAGGAPFKLFCKRITDVSLVAVVNQGASTAFVWLDDRPAQIWSLKPTAALLASSAVQDGSTTEKREEMYTAESFALLEQSNSTAAVLALLGETSQQGGGNDFIMQPSAPSQTFSVGAGEHTLVFQGRPEDTEAFAMGSIRLQQGGDACTFFLEGKDKMPDDC